MPRWSSSLSYAPGATSAVFRRELEGGLLHEIEIRCPAVLTIQLGINTPRYASLRSIKQAAAKPIEVLVARRISAWAPADVGEAGSLSRVRRMYVPDKGRAQLIEGDAAAAGRAPRGDHPRIQGRGGMSGVLVVAEQRRGELRPVSLELVGAAQGLRRAGEQCRVAILDATPGGMCPRSSVAGVDEIIAIKVPAPEFDPDTFESAVGALIAARKPDVVLVAHSVDSFGYRRGARRQAGPWLRHRRVQGRAHRRRARGDARRLRPEGQRRGRLSGTQHGAARPARQRVQGRRNRPHRRRSPRSRRPSIRRDLPGANSSSCSASDDVDMTAAEFILTIGRGIGEEAKVAQFRELADAIGATLGCSRPIADAGWLPKSRQVGQSGKTASACKLYIAMGVSGAIQHLAGMKHVATIVAVNSDAEASIFGVAKYGIVGDIFEIAEELRRYF